MLHIFSELVLLGQPRDYYSYAQPLQSACPVAILKSLYRVWVGLYLSLIGSTCGDPMLHYASAAIVFLVFRKDMVPPLDYPPGPTLSVVSFAAPLALVSARDCCQPLLLLHAATLCSAAL